MKILYSTLALTMLASCTRIPGDAYFNRGQPESLLSVASEEVTISLDSSGGVRQLTDWIDRQQPSRARLVCASDDVCDSAAQVLDQYNIPYDQSNGAINQVNLTFENVEAHDCQSSYVSNHINPYNLHHPTFGCSIAVNQVQMVTDKTSFTEPKLLDPYDGQKSVQNYDTYISREPINLNNEQNYSTGDVGQQ